MRRLEAVDIGEVLALHELVVRSLPDTRLYRRSPREHFERHIAAEGLTLGVFGADRLIGYGLLRFPGGDPDNLGRDVGLDERALAGVAHLEECAIHPGFRGHRLQLELTARRLCVAASLGYRHALVTISPLNRPSLANHLRHGLRVARLTEKYGGLVRFVLHRELAFCGGPGCRGGGERAADSTRPLVRAAVVPLGSLATIGAYLAAGYRGCALQSEGQTDALVLVGGHTLSAAPAGAP